MQQEPLQADTVLVLEPVLQVEEQPVANNVPVAQTNASIIIFIVNLWL